MPVNHNYEIIFIHIPKTGGTSIESFFEMTEPENLSFSRWDLDHAAFMEKYKDISGLPEIHYEPQHYVPGVLKKLIPEYDNYFSFSFTRHPYTRLLSEYYWLRNKQVDSVNDFNAHDFHEWCVSFLSLINSSHKEPQVNYIDDSIHFVGKFENLSEDFELLKLKLLNFSPDFDPIKDKALEQLNSTGSDKNKLIPYLLIETKQLIYSVYKSDFDVFSYDPELFVPFDLMPAEEAKIIRTVF